MPIDLTRDEDIKEQLKRLSYGEGVTIKEQVYQYLYANHKYAFTADTLSARIETAATPVQIESVLSNHPDVFAHSKESGDIYWYIKEE